MRLLRAIREKVPNYSATINCVKVTMVSGNDGVKLTKDDLAHSEAEDVEEISTEDMTEYSPEENEAFIQTVLVNDIQIGHACCPFEIL